MAAVNDKNGIWALYETAPYPCFLLDEKFNVTKKNAAAKKNCYNRLCRPGVLSSIIEKSPQSLQSLQNGAAASFDFGAAEVSLGTVTVIPLTDGLYAAMLPLPSSLSGAMLCAGLRESLSSVFSVIPVIQRKLDGDSDAEKYLTHLLKSSYITLRTVQNYSAWSALCGDITVKELNLNRVLKGIFDTCAAICRGCGVKISYTDLTEKEFAVFADKEILEIAVSNIILNSILYAADDGEIEICLNRIGKNAVISFSDNGKGIKPDALPYVFEPYYSTDPYMDGEPRPGLGLGLAIVMQAATVFGGSCNIESKFGEGCTVTVTLPCHSIESGSVISSEAADYLTNRFSVPYVQLSPVCVLPR